MSILEVYLWPLKKCILLNQNLLPSFSFEIYSVFLLVSMLVISLLILIFGSIRLFFLNRRDETAYSNAILGNPKVTIHLSIGNHTPQSVLNSIESICNLNYKNFELLVIANNTLSQSLWKPVETYIFNLDNRFKLINFNEDNVCKTDTLNYALDVTSKDTDYIFTVDADYILNKDALNIAIGTIQKRNVQLLQFPQAYSNSSSKTSGIETHYKKYFESYLKSISSKILVLPTENLTLIDKKVFDNGYRWPKSIMNDELSYGIELTPKYVKIAFCNYILARGKMPTESKDYGNQFKIWTLVNLQILSNVWKTKGISLGKKIHLSTLFTAWINLLGIVFIVVLAAIPLVFINNQYVESILLIGTLNIVLHYVFQLMIYFAMAKNNLKKAWYGFLVHLGLLEIGAFYWMYYFILKEKSLRHGIKYLPKVFRNNRLYLFPIMLFMVSGICFILQQNLIAIVIGVFGLQIMQAKFHTDQEIIWSKFNLYNNN